MEYLDILLSSFDFGTLSIKFNDSKKHVAWDKKDKRMTIEDSTSCSLYIPSHSQVKSQ